MVIQGPAVEVQAIVDDRVVDGIDVVVEMNVTGQQGGVTVQEAGRRLREQQSECRKQR